MKEITLLVKIRGPFFLRGALGDCLFCLYARASCGQYEKYLGLPALVGRAKKQSFIYIKKRVWRKLQGWKEKLLSQASREVLIKSVI